MNIGKNVQIRKRFVKDLLRDQIGVVVGKFVEQMEQVPEHIVLTVPAKWTDDKSNGKEIAMLQEVLRQQHILFMKYCKINFKDIF